MHDAKSWEGVGQRVSIGGHGIFVVDLPAEREVETPALILHGFPTSSLEWSEVVPLLRRTRRVLSFDLLGFGCSDKPDQPYSLFQQADLAEAVVEHVGVQRLALLTHDVGDSIGGELLARSLEGKLRFEITQRAITNGSIYMELVELSQGQLALLRMPDALLSADRAVPPEVQARALLALMGESHRAAAEPRVRELVTLMRRDDGHLLLPRIIRYIEERRVHEARWTGAIERHPAPLGIVWGDLDPVAVHAMALRLAERVPGARLETMTGVGHYPMVEDPVRFARLVTSVLP